MDNIMKTFNPHEQKWHSGRNEIFSAYAIIKPKHVRIAFKYKLS